MREVRLGLVCYGGVSLAIYMHGVTKELYKLVRAARAFECAYEANDFDAAKWLTGAPDVQGSPNYDSERAYFDALVALKDQGDPLTVVVDIIAGTSAGGINGVCLARGLAEGRSLNGFRNLWLAQADMEELLAGHALVPWGPAKMWSKLADSVAHLGWHHDDGLLDGDLMSRLLYQALNDMEPIEDSLVPANESLDLFVTTTNVYGYDTVIPTGAGGISHTDKSYRQLLRFHYDQLPQPPGPAVADISSDFSDVPALAFAARATASFPGAFPPVSLGTFVKALGNQPGNQADSADQIARHFVYGTEYGATEAGQWFMDGGVLDNGPFDHVLDAIAAKRADGPTVRELIYIEPDPGSPPRPDQQAPDPEPTFAETVWAARITIPQHTPLVGVLGQLETMNAAIGEVGAIVEAQEPEVLGYLTAEAPSAAALAGAAGYADVTDHAEQVRQAAQQLTGRLGYATYGRLRAQAVAEAFAASLAAELGFPAESNRANFMVATFCAWARQQAAWQAAEPDALEAQLGAVDVPFRLRRAQLVLDGINDLFAAADPGMRTDLATMKSATWDLITALRARQQQVALEVRDQAMALFGPQALTQDGYLADPETYAAQGPGGRGADLSRLYDACLRAIGAGRRHRHEPGPVGSPHRAHPDLGPGHAGSAAVPLRRLPDLGLADLPGDLAGEAAPADTGQRAAVQPARRDLPDGRQRRRDAQGRPVRQARRHLDPPLRRVFREALARERLPVGPARRRRAGHAPARPPVRRRPGPHRLPALRADRDPDHGTARPRTDRPRLPSPRRTGQRP